MIPFLDLKAQYETIRPEIEPAVLDVLASGQYVLGERVAALEEAFAAYCGTQYAVAVNSGTSALHLALLAAGIGPGDEVITTPMTFVATVAAIEMAGARVVLADVEPETLTLDPFAVERAITPRTKAILPVHLYGQMADMDPILEIARRRRLIVIEDACQAHGAEYRGQRAGSMGVSGCFSFYPGKNLGAYGEGGMVVTSNEAHMRRVRMLRDWGQAGRYQHVLKGYNYRMDAIQGAILGIKLSHLEDWIEARRARAGTYRALFADMRLALPAEAEGRRHVWHLFVVRSRDRDALRRELEAEGIGTGLHYPVPVHLQPAYADLGYRHGDFPVAEEAAASVLSLPLYPELSMTQIERVAEAIGQFAYVH